MTQKISSKLSRKWRGAILAVILLVAFSAYIYSFAPSGAINSKDPLSIGVVLQIDVHDVNGNLKHTMVKDDDLITNNTAVVLQALLTDPLYATTVLATPLIKTTGAATTSLTVCATTSTGTVYYWYTAAAADNGGFIQVGTGVNAAAITDYVLGAAVESPVYISDPVYADGNITFSAAITMTDNRTVSEACFVFHQAANYYMYFRDTFGGIDVVIDDTVTVTYTLALGAGFTDNFGEILAGTFRYTPATVDTNVTLTDINGNPYVFWVQSDTQTHLLTDTNVGQPQKGVIVGTGSGTANRTDYCMDTPVESMASNYPPVITDGINVALAGIVTVSANRTITEAAYYFKGMDTGGTPRTIMLWREVFGGVEVIENNAITVTFVLKPNS